MLVDGKLLLLPFGVLGNKVCCSSIHHGVSQPAFKEYIAIGLQRTQVTSEDSDILLLSPGLGVVDEEEMPYLLQFQDY